MRIDPIDSVKVKSSITFKTAKRARIREQRQLEAIQTIQEHDRVSLTTNHPSYIQSRGDPGHVPGHIPLQPSAWYSTVNHH